MKASLTALIRRVLGFYDLQFVRFVLYAGVNTLLTYALYALLTFVMPYSIAYTISYLSGIGISYVLYSRYVFRAALRLGKFIQYPIVYVVQYLLNITLLSVLVSAFHIDRLIAPWFVILLSMPVTFLLSRVIITRKAAGGEAPPS